MAALEGRYDYKTAEPALQQGWDESGIYRFDPQRAGPHFTVDTPPPTVSGRIHVGHVYSYTHADIMIRYHRMKGEPVFYPFGFDDNGLPTEIFTENSMGIRARDVGRRAFIEACLSLSRQVEGQFERFWKRLGLSVDWRLVYSTIDDRSRRISQAAFLRLLEGDNVYRREAPTLWCTTCQTGVAQADVEDKTGVQTLFTTFPFALDGGGEILIATTRPELLAACVAVFVHPDDDRYKDVVGRTARTPIFDQAVPVLADPRADPEKGSGAVMCCTFGDVTDVAWWRDHQLPLRIALTEDGRMNALAGAYQGLTVREARRRVLEDLRDAGLIRSQVAIEHTVGVHERGGHDLEFLVTRQWFVKLLEHKDRWLDAGRRIRWHPEHMRSRYENWIEGLNWDWNISRQRYYGVPFPVWYCRACERIIPAGAEQLPVDPQETPPPVSACPVCGGTDFEPDPDVMDTWATSSVTPQICGSLLEPFGITPADFDARFRPMSLRPNAHDIIRTWDFYTVVRSLYATGDVPWTDVLISGHALDPSGKKISKSKLRAAEDPMPMLEQFSADAVRYWASSVRTGGDTNLSEEVFRNGSKLVTKLWNASKFARSHIESGAPAAGAAPDLNASDRWLLARLHEVIRRSTAAMEEYEFAIAKGETERFFWTDLCDNYLELIKLRLYGGATGRNGQAGGAGNGAPGPAAAPAADGAAPDGSGARYVLAQALPAVIKLLAPFMPHITDAIYSAGLGGEAGTSVHIAAWPVAPAAWDDPAARTGGEAIIQVVDAVRRWKAERKLSVGAPVGSVRVACPPERRAALESARLDLLGVTRAQALLIEDAPAGEAVGVAVAPVSGDALASPNR